MKKNLNILIIKYRDKKIKMTRLLRKWNVVIFIFSYFPLYLPLKYSKFCHFYVFFNVCTLRICTLNLQVTLYWLVNY